MAAWLLILAIAALVSGLGLVVLGLRGRRINDHPICRGCRFDLVGIFPGAARCPECGRDLARRRALRKGERRRRRVVIVLGVLLFLVGSGGGGVGVWTRMAKFDWYAAMPSDALL